MWLHALQLSSMCLSWIPVYRCPSTASPGTSTSLWTAQLIWCRPQGVSNSPCPARSATALSLCMWQRVMGFLSEISALMEWSRKFRCTPTSPSQLQAGTSARRRGLFLMSALVRRSQVIHEYVLSKISISWSELEWTRHGSIVAWKKIHLQTFEKCVKIIMY